MDGLAIAALLLVGLWLGALTLVAILCVRQIGLLSVRFAQAGGSFSLADDGPAVGSVLPAEVTATVPELGRGRAQILLVAATCTPCRELAAQLGGERLPGSVVALVPGHQDLADGLVALLPPGLRVVRNPDAARLAESLHIKSTPFGLAVEDGRIVDKAYLHSAADFTKLIGGGKAPKMRAALQREVRHVG